MRPDQILELLEAAATGGVIEISPELHNELAADAQCQPA